MPEVEKASGADRNGLRDDRVKELGWKPAGKFKTAGLTRGL